MRECTDCGQIKPLDARYFLPITGPRGRFYGRCRVCRNKRARQRYWATLAILDAERALARRNAEQRRRRMA